MTDQPANEILLIVRQFRAALARNDAQALKRLVDAYGRIYARLKDKIELLSDAIAMEEPTAGQLVRMQRYNALIRQTEAELRDYQVILRNEVQSVSQNAVAFAQRDTARMARVMGQAYGINITFNRLPTDAIQTLLGFLDPEGPLYERIGQLARVNAQTVADKILEGVGLGQNPRAIAGIIRDSLGGGLTDALRMTRTVQLWSYREATRANYINNSDIIEGWIWWADLGGDPCMACIAEHGTEHTLDETLDDHYNGRCTMIPMVSGFQNPVEQSGEDWFTNLADSKQQELMGPEFYDAWKGGAFSLTDLINAEHDDVYGTMRATTPLWNLLGSEPPVTK